MLGGTVYIYESQRSYWNIVEDNRRLWKTIEPYRSLWKMQEHSIGKLCKHGESSLEYSMKEGSERLGNKGRQSMTTKVLMPPSKRVTTIIHDVHPDVGKCRGFVTPRGFW